MIYTTINTPSDLSKLYEQIERHVFGIESSKFLREQSIKVYGFFHNDNDSIDDNTLIVYGKTIAPDELPSIPSTSIFSKVKQYGSSFRYKGLYNVFGKVILEPQFDEITYFEYGIFIGKRKDRCCLIKANGVRLTNLTYDNFFDAGENTIAFVANQKLGFMNVCGEIVIEAQYDCYLSKGKFENGFAEVVKVDDEGESYLRIDHYNCVVENIDYVPFDNSEHHLGTGYYLYGDLPDSSDAYEGDDTNRWNTD